MPYLPPVAIDEETVYFIHVQSVEIPEFVFTVRVPASGADNVANKDAIVQKLVNMFEGNPNLTVMSAEKRIAATRNITPE